MKWPDEERLRGLGWLALAVYLVGLGIAAVLRNQADFNTYYLAGERVLGGLPIYPPTDSDRFLYAPIFALGFAPIAALPLKLAQLAFFIVNAFALVELVIGTGVMLFGRERQLPAALIVIPVALCFRFIGNNIEHGQINLIVFAVIVWAIIYSDEKRAPLAGLMLAAAILIKPFAILAAAYIFIRGRFNSFGWTIVGGIILIVAPVVIFGPHRWVLQTTEYVQAISSMTVRYRTMLTNQSAVSAVARLLEPVSPEDLSSPLPLAIGMGFEAVLAAAVLIWAWFSGREDRIALSGLFCVMPGLAPISWKSYFAALIVPYMLLTTTLTTEDAPSPAPLQSRAALALFVVSVILNLAPGNKLNRLALFYSAHLISALFALAAVFVLWMRSGSSRAATAKIAS
jgi:Glycosyltransferase family 87